MAHETFLTDKDKMASSVQPGRTGVFLTWGAIAAGLAVAAVISTSIIAGIALLGGAGFAAYKAIEARTEDRVRNESHSDAAPSTVASASISTPSLEAGINLENNKGRIPQVADDVPENKWRKSIEGRAEWGANKTYGRGL